MPLPGVFIRFQVGRAGTSSANVRYITRGAATGFDPEAVLTRNYPDYAREGNDYRDYREHLEEFARQREEDELERSHRGGGGSPRTHYRAVLSFEGKVDTDKARSMADEYMERTFPEGRAVAAVHQDTDHTHVHIHLQSRDADDQKLHFDRNAYRHLDHEWSEIYGREFGHEKAVEHEEKKTETHERRVSAASGRDSFGGGSADRADRPLERGGFHQREERNHGADQARTGGPERGTASAADRGDDREPSLEGLAGECDRAVQAADRTADEARAAIRAAETVADRELERDDGRVEERGR